MTTSPETTSAYGALATIVTVLAHGTFAYLRDRRREKHTERRIDAVKELINENTQINVQAIETANHANEKITRVAESANSEQVIRELRAVRDAAEETRLILGDTRRELKEIRTSGDETRGMVERLGRVVADRIREHTPTTIEKASNGD